MKERIGIYPGTFDPITTGHIDIIERALIVVDKLIIAVAMDIPKTPTFSLVDRAEMVCDTISTLDQNGRIAVETFEGLLVDFVEDRGASIIIRGLRAVSDFEYEFQMACMNAKLRPEIETVLLPASESTQFISSRFVKEIARLGGDVSSFVSPKVCKRLMSELT